MIAPVGSGKSDVVAYCGLSLLRCFADSGIAVTVVDSDAESLTLHSRYASKTQMIACPRLQPEQAVADLIALGKQFATRPMLTFDNEPMLLLVSRNRQALSPYYRFLLPDNELVEDLTCKLRFASLAERLDLPVPRSMTPAKDTTVEEIALRMGLPCVLKPNSHTGRYRTEVERERRFVYKVLQADSLEDLRKQYAKMRQYCDSFLAQEYVPGDDTTLYSVHAYLDGNGNSLGCFVGRKIRTCPKGCGGSTYLELVHHPELAQLGMKLLRQMNAVGPMKIDFKRDTRHNRWLILECNARFTLWNYLGAASGMNLPKVALADLYERPAAPATTYRTNVRWLALGNDFRAFLHEYRPDGDWTWARWLWSLRFRKVHEVFSWSDPKPAIICTARFLWLNVLKIKRRLIGKGRRPSAPMHPDTAADRATPAGAALPGHNPL